MPYAHLVDLDCLDQRDWDDLVSLAREIRRYPKEYQDRCRGRILATLFYEPSTRTMFSFQAAMLKLGGSYIGFDNPVNSSVSKGESLKDTVKIVANYADIMVMRHPLEGAAYAASLYSRKPIINAGDGGHLHPTQTLTDVATLIEEKGCAGGLTVGICGDLKYSRTVHSLIKTLSRFPGNRYYLISTPALRLPDYILSVLEQSGSEYRSVPTIEECIGECDVLYMTRIQRERFESAEAYESQRGIYILDGEKMKRAKSSLLVMHPLPKVDEISDEVDLDPRAAYFRQAEYGMYMRMALIIRMLERKPPEPCTPGPTHRHACPNPRCITRAEKYLPALFERRGEALVCRYCETSLELNGPEA